MADSPQKDIFTRLADAGEDAIQRLGGAPGLDKMTSAVNTLRERMDEMQRRLRGLDHVQEQLRTIEQRLDRLEGKAPASAAGSSEQSSSAASESAPRAKTPGTASTGSRPKKSSSS